MSNAIVMVHGVGGTADAWSRLAPAFRDKGWRVETPTLYPHMRLAENPPADLPKVRFRDYIAEIEALARALEAETGTAPVLFGHSMGGLIVQKLLERGVGRAGVLVTPASPGDCRGSRHPAQAVTFANILFSGDVAGKSHKIWPFGFSWGVLNRVPRAKHAGIFAGTVYDSGGVYTDIAYPERDPERSAFVDETKITVPVLTLGGARDRAVPISDVRLLAEKYSRIGGDYLEYPDHGHWIVDEPGTDQVISDIDTWLASKGLTPVAAKAGVSARKAVAKPAAARAKPRAAPVVVKPTARPVAAAKVVAPKATPGPKAAAKPAPVAKPAAAKAKPAAKAASKVKTPVRKPKST
ncbi:MAG: alpha/beta fold hydrolase [Caulobacterales bacterium]|nr:alpha/beta fold hydrolase [Caulobacterales bacterium]